MGCALLADTYYSIEWYQKMFNPATPQEDEFSSVLSTNECRSCHPLHPPEHGKPLSAKEQGRCRGMVLMYGMHG